MLKVNKSLSSSSHQDFLLLQFILAPSLIIHSCLQSTEMIDWNTITSAGDQSLWASSFMLAKSQPVCPLNAVRNLLNFLCEFRRENRLANSDKHLFKNIFVLLRSPSQLLLGCHGNRHTHHLHISFCNEHKITKPSWQDGMGSKSCLIRATSWNGVFCLWREL